MTPIPTVVGGPSAAEVAALAYQPRGARFVVKRPEELFITLWGAFGSGKSYFLQSHPGCVIINFDRAPSVNPYCRAEIWPATASGVILWPAVMEEVAHIVEARERGLRGAPVTVALDGLEMLVDCARRHVASDLLLRRARKRDDGQPPRPEDIERISEDKVDPIDIRWLDGMTTWDLTYGIIMYLIHRMRAAGLGVILVGHIGQEVVRQPQPGGAVLVTERPRLMVTEKFYERFAGAADLAAMMVATDIVEPPGPGGGVPTQLKRTALLTRHPILDSHLKRRNDGPALPERIPLSRENGWADFAAAYTRCCAVHP